MYLINSNTVVANAHFLSASRLSSNKYNAEDFETPFGVILPLSVGGWAILDFFKNIEPKELQANPGFNNFMLPESGITDFIHISNTGSIYVSSACRSRNYLELRRTPIPKALTFSYYGFERREIVDALNALLREKKTLQDCINTLRLSTRENFTETIIFNAQEYKSNKPYHETLLMPSRIFTGRDE